MEKGVTESIHIKFCNVEHVFRTINEHEITEEEWQEYLSLGKGKNPFIKLHETEAEEIKERAQF